jgi:hypothetical protein
METVTVVALSKFKIPKFKTFYDGEKVELGIDMAHALKERGLVAMEKEKQKKVDKKQKKIDNKNTN